jgi:hypothetical protein
MHKETRDISSLRQIFKYIWPLFIFFILFAAVCAFNAVFMFLFENKEANLNSDKLRHSIDSLKLNSIDLTGIEKYVWEALSGVALIILIVVTLILLTCKLKHSHKFEMENEHIKAALLSESTFSQFPDLCCCSNVSRVFKYIFFFGILAISVLIEIITPFVPLILNVIMLVMLVVYSFYVWCLNINGVYKFLLIYYAKIMLNIFSNIIIAIRTFTNCNWLYLNATSKEPNKKWMSNKAAAKIWVFVRYVLFKNIFNCIEIAFFDMSLILCFKLGEYFKILIELRIQTP